MFGLAPLPAGLAGHDGGESAPQLNERREIAEREETKQSEELKATLASEKSSPPNSEKKIVTGPNPTVQLMKEQGIPLTWPNFLAVEYLGNPPELDAEVEAELSDAYDAVIWHELGIEPPEEDE